ncbi:MAG: septum formation inhibitor Maf [Pseudomonadales bacterium]|nr:septum formation inhibitor Maf [Pseudomonadales bacterium]MBO6565991.1 septum formation inhibitor Maf [Pseudomonadales bacterium]MBO6594218.1 septum formation inhibitor Maf [Pseudomonadales bacterium]MBO6656319.1 septum formation inhibitor Maf [Pseudomonadales bacterium]MBO6822221.1 septum formation inhibitor Maf [Pseudomonadales bacterium]
MSTTLILASGSPRRRQLLTQLGISFDVMVSDIDETPQPGESPRAYVERLSLEKASSVADRLDVDDSVILAADTTVVLEGNILGKPESKEHGIEMLMGLSGTTHRVLTGVCVTSTQQATAGTLSVETQVRFKELTLKEAEWYWDTGEPKDKAGGYGLQGIGAAFVVTLDGSYSNVIGLPLSETVDLLRAAGVRCLEVSDRQEFQVDVRQSNG